MRTKFPEDLKDFILTHCKGLSILETAELVNNHYNTAYTTQQLVRYKYRNGIRTGKARNGTARTKALCDFVEKVYKGKSYLQIRDLAREHLADNTITVPMISHAMQKRGLKGRDTRFHSGQKPWNTGGVPEHMRELFLGKARQMSEARTKDIGTISTRGRGLAIKTSAGWIPYHKYIWEQTHGKIPTGYVLKFLDNNPRNCALDNLVLISRQEHGRLLALERYSDNSDIALANIALTKLEVVIEDKEKKKQ